jgi:nitrogen regulatory protein PII
MNSFMVVFVMDDSEYLEEVLSAWEEVGVSGVTVLHSTGLGRVRQSIYMDDLPIFPSLENLEQAQESFSRTLFTVVDSLEIVQEVVNAAQRVVGDLSNPRTGVLFVLPVVQAFGLNKTSR